MQQDDFLCDRQTQPSAAGIRDARRIQPIKFVEQRGQLLRGDRFPLILKGNGNEVPLALCGDNDLGFGIAIRDRVFEDIAKHAPDFFRVGVNRDIFVQLQRNRVMAL